MGIPSVFFSLYNKYTISLASSGAIVANVYQLVKHQLLMVDGPHGVTIFLHAVEVVEEEYSTEPVSAPIQSMLVFERGYSSVLSTVIQI